MSGASVGTSRLHGGKNRQERCSNPTSAPASEASVLAATAQKCQSVATVIKVDLIVMISDVFLLIVDFKCGINKELRFPLIVLSE